MGHKSSNYIILVLLLWILQLSLSLDDACSHGDQNCDSSNPSNKYRKDTNSGQAVQPKKIIYWTHFYGHRDFEFGFGQEPFNKAECAVSNCIATSKLLSFCKILHET